MHIQDFFKENLSCAVAFSGGVDSAYLLCAAAAYGQRTAAYFVKTPFQPDFELEDARKVASRLGTSLTVLEFDILTVPEVAANPQDRCYYCKRALFTRLIEAAGADGFPLVLDGCNASDDISGRPGMRALRELGVRSPSVSAASRRPPSAGWPMRLASLCGTSPPMPASPPVSLRGLPSPGRT